jgi:saccharopine dehydrogenase (NAD+, L-lysine-forming)
MAVPYNKIGIIREGKQPADRRVPLTPAQCKEVMQRFPEVDLVVQRSGVRAFSDAEYEVFEIPLVDDLGDRDLILGVKEVPLDMLLADKSLLLLQPHDQGTTAQQVNY